MSLNISDIKNFSSLFYKILNEHEQLRCFYNSIVFGSLTQDGYCHPNYSLFLKKEGDYYKSGTHNNSSIKIVNFTISSFSKIIEYKGDYGRNLGFYNQVIEHQIFKNQKYYNNQIPLKAFQFNLNPDIDVKYCYLNFYDISKFFNSFIGSYNMEKIPELYYIGKKNNLLAIFLRSQNVLIIREQVLLSLYKNNGLDQTKSILEKLLKIYLKKSENYATLNIQNFSNYSQNFLEFNIYNHLYQWIDTNNQKFEKFSDDQIKELKENISELVQSFRNDIFINTIFNQGKNNVEYYQELISDILHNQKKIQEKISQQSFQDGMILGLKIEMLGWIPKSQNFSDEHDSSIIWWQKDVNIIPDTFIYKDERYEIPLKQRKWKITKLFINKNGKMRCVGNHPNVSGSLVCMGDLRIDWTKSIDELKISLQNAETLLDIINFDSAYSTSELSGLLETSTKIKFLSKTNIKTKEIKQIKEVSFSESDEGEEIIIVKEKENKVIETKKYKIEQVQKYSDLTEDDFIESEREENNNTYETTDGTFNIMPDGSLSVIPVINENNQIENNSSNLELTDSDIL